MSARVNAEAPQGNGSTVQSVFSAEALPYRGISRRGPTAQRFYSAEGTAYIAASRPFPGRLPPGVSARRRGHTPTPQRRGATGQRVYRAEALPCRGFAAQRLYRATGLSCRGSAAQRVDRALALTLTLTLDPTADRAQGASSWPKRPGRCAERAEALQRLGSTALRVYSA